MNIEDHEFEFLYLIQNARGPEVPIGLAHGHPDDPDTHTWDTVVDTTPDLGGKRLPQ